MDETNGQSWTKCAKQIRGAMGCVAGLANSWPGGMGRSERSMIRRISERLSLLLEQIEDARADGRGQDEIERVKEVFEQIHDGEIKQ